jgi:hypothetical protein
MKRIKERVVSCVICGMVFWGVKMNQSILYRGEGEEENFYSQSLS